jgi:DNA-binding CsgD family transcriptional regulator
MVQRPMRSSSRAKNSADVLSSHIDTVCGMMNNYYSQRMGILQHHKFNCGTMPLLDWKRRMPDAIIRKPRSLVYGPLILHGIESRAREIVYGFFEAAMNPGLWPSALKILSDALDAEGCVLTPGPHAPLAPVVSPDLDGMLDYALREGWIEKNARNERSIAAFGHGQDIVTESMVFSPWELDNVPYNSEFINRFHYRWFAAMTLAGHARSSIILELQRPACSKPFSGLEIETLRRLRPHLREAADMALHLADIHHDGLLAAFRTLNCGVILLDWRGRVLRLGTTAEFLVRTALMVRGDGTLRARACESDAALQQLIGLAIGGGEFATPGSLSVVSIARAGALPLLVHAVVPPQSGADRFKQARAVLLLAEPNANGTSRPPDLCQMFGLTSSEAATVGALVQGHDTREIARTLRIGYQTVRTHLRSAFAKTGTRRQAELVTLVLRCARLPG